MWLDSNQVYKDLEQIAETDFIPWEKLSGKTILVTGATGLIGYAVVTGLLYAGQKHHLNLKVLAVVRDLNRARQRFKDWISEKNLFFIHADVETMPEIEEPVDYIIHGASQTSSQAFVSQAVETIHTSIYGTDNLLRLAREKETKGFVYLSSMEVYGHPPKGHKVRESDTGAFDPLNLRNSYPIGKQLSENLCCAYATEYDVPVMIARLTQTFGAGVNYNDSRVFAEFGRCALEKRDIILKTKGETERSYLYIADAVTAIICILLKGRPGCAYNVADENTYCSIAEMAQRVADIGGVKVRFDSQDGRKLGYPDTIYMDLDTSLLRSLGWSPRGGATVIEMFKKMIEGWRIYSQIMILSN